MKTSVFGNVKPDISTFVSKHEVLLRKDDCYCSIECGLADRKAHLDKSKEGQDISSRISALVGEIF